MAGVHVLPGYASYFRNSVLEGNLSQVVVINNEPPNPIQLNIETLSRHEIKVPMKRIFFSQKYRHLGAENQKIQEKFCRKVLQRNPRVSKIPNLP